MRSYPGALVGAGEEKKRDFVKGVCKEDQLDRGG